MEYTVDFARSARRELQKLPRDVARRLLELIESLAADPRPAGCVKLRGSKDLWRVRSGDYRVVYQIIDEELLVVVLAARHRGDAYRP